MAPVQPGPTPVPTNGSTEAAGSVEGPCDCDGDAPDPVATTGAAARTIPSARAELAARTVRAKPRRRNVAFVGRATAEPRRRAPNRFRTRQWYKRVRHVSGATGSGRYGCLLAIGAMPLRFHPSHGRVDVLDPSLRTTGAFCSRHGIVGGGVRQVARTDDRRENSHPRWEAPCRESTVRVACDFWPPWPPWGWAVWSASRPPPRRQPARRRPRRSTISATRPRPNRASRFPRASG